MIQLMKQLKRSIFGIIVLALVAFFSAYGKKPETVEFPFIREVSEEETTAEKYTIEEVDKAEPYVFHVRDLENVRLDGVCSSDFYITSAATGDCLYYVDAEGVLYGTRNSGARYSRFLKEGEEAMVTKIAENVIHVDCCGLYNVTAWITAGGQLYVAGSGLEFFRENAGIEYASPYLLMEGVCYVRCGCTDIVIMKEDGTVWVWGTVSDGQFQGNNERLAEPLKLLENALMITGTQYSHAALLKDGTVWIWGGVTSVANVGFPSDRFQCFQWCVSRRMYRRYGWESYSITLAVRSGKDIPSMQERTDTIISL